MHIQSVGLGKVHEFLGLGEFEAAFRRLEIPRLHQVLRRDGGEIPLQQIEFRG